MSDGQVAARPVAWLPLLACRSVCLESLSCCFRCTCTSAWRPSSVSASGTPSIWLHSLWMSRTKPNKRLFSQHLSDIFFVLFILEYIYFLGKVTSFEELFDNLKKMFYKFSFGFISQERYHFLQIFCDKFMLWLLFTSFYAFYLFSLHFS